MLVRHLRDGSEKPVRITFSSRRHCVTVRGNPLLANIIILCIYTCLRCSPDRPPLTDPHCKTGVLTRCPLGYAGGDARATFFACRTSWFLEPAAQQSSTFLHCCRPLMAMFS